MISRLMPLPMPYSSICSPSHIRNTVPAVMVSTPTNCQPKQDAAMRVGRIAEELRVRPARWPERNPM